MAERKAANMRQNKCGGEQDVDHMEKRRHDCRDGGSDIA